MSLSYLPLSTSINRSIPKNAFDKYTNSKQKRIFIDSIDKIKWSNKIATETINLPSVDIKEIQVFEINLKEKVKIKEILDIIDKSIPYHIVFIIYFNEFVMISTSKKHAHVTNENLAVIDWTFETDWILNNQVIIKFNLKQNIDFIYSDLCFQINGNVNEGKNIIEIIALESQIKSLKYQISKLESAIKNSKQFNKKVELNQELIDKKKQLELLVPKT
jgi:hypothetical protein